MMEEEEEGTDLRAQEDLMPVKTERETGASKHNLSKVDFTKNFQNKILGPVIDIKVLPTEVFP